MHQSERSQGCALGLGCYNNLDLCASTVRHRGLRMLFLVPESIFIPFWILDVTGSRGGGEHGKMFGFWIRLNGVGGREREREQACAGAGAGAGPRYE